jgi:acyl-CoA dehydrogenase
LMVLFAADKIDQCGSKGAKEEIALIKIVTPNVALKIIDRAIQLHGAEGVSQDTFLAYAWSAIRTLRIADGPDEVHMRSVGREAVKKFKFSSKF